MPLKNLLEKLLPVLEEGQPVRSLEFNEDELKLLRSMQLLTSKPVLYVANVNENGFSENPYLTQLEDFVRKENSQVVAVCADD